MDLIAEACREQGITSTKTGFEAAIEEQRTRARKIGVASSMKRRGGPQRRGGPCRNPAFVRANGWIPKAWCRRFFRVIA